MAAPFALAAVLACYFTGTANFGDWWMIALSAVVVLDLLATPHRTK